MSEQEQLNQQVALENAVAKAIDGGWSSRVPVDGENTQIALIANNCVSIRYVTEGGAMSYSTSFSLFDKEFAKALWGEAELQGLDALFKEDLVLTGAKRTHYWQYHLQMMVISDDPIKYLGDHLE